MTVIDQTILDLHDQLEQDIIWFKLLDSDQLTMDSYPGRRHRQYLFDYTVAHSGNNSFWVKQEIEFIIVHLTDLEVTGWWLVANSRNEDELFDDQGPFTNLHDAIVAANEYSDMDVPNE